MSYIKINIGGKDRGLKFNQGALMIFQSLVDNENYEATTFYALIYAGLKSNCYVKREDADFTFEEVCDWVEELNKDVVLQVVACFKETQAYKALLPVEKEDKKKSHSKSTKTTALK